MKDQDLEVKLTLLDELQSSCTGCGLCSEACATFQATGWEQESPRGRLHLASEFLHGRVPLQSSALETFDRCLGCQACELSCPQRVPYRDVRQLVQDLRTQLQSDMLCPEITGDEYRRWITLAHRIGHRLWRQYGWKWLAIPSFESVRIQGSFTALKRKCLVKNQPVLAICCIQDLFQHEVIEQTLRFMERLGYPLQVDKSQPCCGALFERLIRGGKEAVCYSQEQQRAFALQRKTLSAFLRWLPSMAYFLAQGCQCFIAKHAPHGCDLYTLIEMILKEKQWLLYFEQPREVYYQPYCGRPARDGYDPIWRILRQIEGLTLRDISDPLACCGGYCGEVLLHPHQAQRLVSQKLSALPEEATVIITSPDCWGQFKAHQESRRLHVLYPIQLLTQAHIRIPEVKKGIRPAVNLTTFS